MALLIEKTCNQATEAVLVTVDRHTLYKRRWRAVAENGTELAVNLSEPVQHGVFLDGGNNRVFLVKQEPEAILAIPLPSKNQLAAQIGWYLGNQHLPVEVRTHEIILEWKDTLAASLDRIGIPYTGRTEVFQCKLHSHQH